MTSLFCLAAPLAGTLMSAVPARMMQQRAYKVGAVIPGWRDIRQLGRINVVQATSRQLFPEGCVTLRDIHPVKMEHIDTAIIYAASMLADTDSTLNKLFTGMVASKSLLEKVTDRQAVPGKGYMGGPQGALILGNRAMMMDYGIKVPSQEYEQHYTLNQRRIVYMAVAGKLYAMFRIAYQSDPKIAADLELVHRTGMYLVVDCDDFNCDVRLLETAYGLPTGSVKGRLVRRRARRPSPRRWPGCPRVRAVCCIWAASAVLARRPGRCRRGRPGREVRRLTAPTPPRCWPAPRWVC